MITKMTRYDFLLLTSQTEEFLKQIQELGIVDITRATKAVDDTSAAMIAGMEELKQHITDLERHFYNHDSQYAELSSKVDELKSEVTKRIHWGEFNNEKLGQLAADGLKLRFYQVSAKKFDQAWENIQALQVIDSDANYVWFVTVSPADAEYSFPVSECEAPAGSVSEARGYLKEAEAALSKRKAELDAIDVNALKAELEKKVTELDFYFANQASEQTAENALTIINGFAPTANDKALKAEFDAMDIYYISSAAAVDDNPPIKFQNNRYVSMFETMTDMYGRPAYDGFDPTPFISVFFLLFFAMCMGDAGYGILMVLLALALRKNAAFGKFAPMVGALGIATFFVGIYFHNFFSVDIRTWSFIPEGAAKFMVPDKLAGQDGAMILSIIIGIVHLCLAMIVKTVVATRNKGFLGSLGIWGWTLLIVGGVTVGGIALTGVMDQAVTRIVIIVLGIVSALFIFLLNDLHRNPLKNIGSGLWETYNTATGLLGDTLSYLRLYALGLAGGMLGLSFNNLAEMTLGDGGLGYIPFILIVVVGHALNMAMAMLGSFVHPLRLNFLEFFKNSGYEGVGRKYNPLKK